MKILIAIALLFTNGAWALHLSAKDSQANGRIFNGINANEGQFPYAVFLWTESTYCGGAVIGREWVLTAGHCVYGMDNIDVYLGMTYLNNATATHKINSDSIVMAPDYKYGPFANDIALIKIPDTPISTFISPVSLPALDQSPISMYTQQDALVCGWGWNGDKGVLAKRLQWTRLPIITNEECKVTYKPLTENEICASTTEGSSACLGDSGSPLVTFKNYTLIGIYSASAPAGCESGKPIVFTRVTRYLQWIKDVTGISY